MIRYHARWVVPIAEPPVENGTVVVHDGRIAFVGPRADAPAGDDDDLGDVLLMPGLVNAHCHLELTAMRRGFGIDLDLAHELRNVGDLAEVTSRLRTIEPAVVGSFELDGVEITQLGATELRRDLLDPLVDLFRIQFTPHDQIIQMPRQRPVQHRSFVK